MAWPWHAFKRRLPFFLLQSRSRGRALASICCDDACNAHVLLAPWSHIAPGRAHAPVGQLATRRFAASIGACARARGGPPQHVFALRTRCCAHPRPGACGARASSAAQLALRSRARPCAPFRASPRAWSPLKACSVGAAPRARPARHGRRGQRADGQPDHRGRLQRGRAPGPRRLPPCSGSLSRRGQKPGGANRFHTGAWQAPAMAAAARGACLRAGGRVAVEARRATRVQRQLAGRFGVGRCLFSFSPCCAGGAA